MSENIDINVALINEEITISAVNNLNEVVVNAVSNTEEINVTANTNFIQVNINTAPLSIINPQNYDLSQFTNTSSNPFVQQSALSSYVPISRTLTINGTTLDLSADRSWTISTNWGSIGGSLSSQGDLVAALAAKQDTLTLTTTGSSGAATLVGATLNIPNYTISGLGGVPSSRTLTINGTTYDLSADRTWTIATGLTVGTTPIASGAVGQILFQGAGNVLQESPNLFWDNTNGRLGIGTNSPNVSLDARNGFNLYTSGAAAGSHYLEAFSTTSTDATLNFRRTAGANGLYRFTLTGAQLNSDNTTGECQLRAANSFFWSVYSNGSETMRIPLTGNILINTTTDAGYKLDVNGTARVQGIITGSVGGGSLTLGAVSANQVAIAVTGYFTGLGAINISNSNPRGYNVRLSAQGEAGFYSSVSSGDFQNFATEINYFKGTGSINVSNPISGSAIHGYLFNPTITNQGLAFVAGFRSTLVSATNRWNLYIDGTASNYLAGNLLINTTTDAGYKLDINGTSRFSGLTDFNADIVLNSNRIFMQSNSGNVLLRMVQTNNLQIYNNNSGATLYLNANGVVQIGQTIAVNWATFSANGHTIYGTTNTNFFSSGNIGINTATDAGYKLDVNGTFRSNGIWTDGSAVTSWGIGSSATAYGVLTWGTGYATVCSTAGNVLHLGANGSSPDVTIDTSGNLGIGTTTAYTTGGTAKLSIAGTVFSFGASNNDLSYFRSLGSGVVQWQTYNSANVGQMHLQPYGGNVLISTTTDAGFKLDVNGTTRVSATDAVSAFQITAPTRAWYFTTSAQGGTFNAISGSANGVAGLGNYGFVISNGWAFNIGLTTSQPDSLFSIYPTATNQGEVRIGGQTGNSTSLLTLESTTKGFLPPRMTTTQKNAIATPATGLVVYDTTLSALSSFNGTVWSTIGGSVAWGSITGTLSTQTDLQSALDAKVPYTGATANVDLGTHTLSAKNIIVNHASGSGVAVSITKGGAGEALTITKTSGSGNAASITGGVTQLDELHLTTDLADSYIASAATWNNKQNALTLTTTGTSGPATLVGDTLNIPEYGGGGGGGTIYKLTSQTLTAASWTLVSGYYQYTFSNVNITVNTRVDFTPANSSYSEVTTCGMLPQVDVAAGSCTFYSLFPPQSDILGEITIFPTV